jgi:hypothetical protein
MENLLSSFWTGFLSSIAAGAASYVILSRYGQASLNSLGFAILIAALALTLFCFYGRLINAERANHSNGINVDKSQHITAETISNSHIVSSDEITLIKK